MSDAEELIGKLAGSDDRQIRTFRDLYGNVSFATTEDVLIDPDSDVRVALLNNIANDQSWPAESMIHDQFENYEGSLNTLTRRVLSRVPRR